MNLLCALNDCCTRKTFTGQQWTHRWTCRWWSLWWAGACVGDSAGVMGLVPPRLSLHCCLSAKAEIADHCLLLSVPMGRGPRSASPGNLVKTIAPPGYLIVTSVQARMLLREPSEEAWTQRTNYLNQFSKRFCAGHSFAIKGIETGCYLNK